MKDTEKSITKRFTLEVVYKNPADLLANIAESFRKIKNGSTCQVFGSNRSQATLKITNEYEDIPETFENKEPEFDTITSTTKIINGKACHTFMSRL